MTTCPTCPHPWHGLPCAGWDPDSRAGMSAGACGCPTSYVEPPTPTPTLITTDEVPC